MFDMFKKFIMAMFLMAVAATVFAEDWKSKVKLDTCMFNQLRGKTIEVMYSTDSSIVICNDCDDVELLAYKFGGCHWGCLENYDAFAKLVSTDKNLVNIINKYNQVLSEYCIIGKTKNNHYYIIKLIP